MTTPLRKLISKCRQAALTEREKEAYFEKPAVAFFKDDAVMKDQFEDVWFSKLIFFNQIEVGVI